MKKFIVFIAVCSLSIASFAQEEGDSDKKKKKCVFFAILTLGLNYSGISGESDSYEGGLFGGYGGIATELLCVNPRFSVVGELGFSMIGSKYKSYNYEPGGGGNSSSNSLRLNYLVLPITGRFKSSNGFRAEAGLQPGLLLSAKDKHSGGTDDAKDLFKSFDMGIVLGAGYQAPKSKWGFGLRFVPGITNINKDDSPYQVKDRNWNASLRLSYNL